MKKQSLAFSMKAAKKFSVAILLIASLLSFSFPSFAESLKELSLETDDFAVKVYRQRQNNQLSIDIWDIKNKHSIANAQEIKKAEMTVIKDVTPKEEDQEIARIWLTPLANSLSTFLLIVFLTLFIWFFLWVNRNRIISLIKDLKIRSINVGQFFTLELEQSISYTYIKQGLGLPSEDDKREIRDVVEHLAPLVEGKRILWVDHHPENNQEEQAIFTKFKIDVQSFRTYELAKRELLARPNYYDLMISDWNGDPQQDPNKDEGLRFWKEISAEIIEIRVIFYYEIVDEQELDRRRSLAKQSGVIGTTGSPGELLKWTMAGLVTKSLQS